MHNALDLTLRRLGEGLQRAGEATVQKPLPWRLLELLCQLDEKEEAIATKGADVSRAEHNRASAIPKSENEP